MTEPTTAARRTVGGYPATGKPVSELSAPPAKVRHEPFIDFPLWGLRKALADHQARCEGCQHKDRDACTDSWYRELLDTKIELAEWRQRHGR